MVFLFIKCIEETVSSGKFGACPVISIRRIACFVLLLVIMGGCGSGTDGRNEDPDPSESFQRTIPLSPSAARFVRLARQELTRQNYVYGLAFADSAIAHAPFAPDGHFVQGLIYFELGRIDEAGASWREVEQMQPDYPGLAHNLGNVAFQGRRYREALTFYARETERSNDPNPWHGLGATHEVLGNATEAQEAYLQAVALDPDYIPAYAALTDWYEREGDFSAALAHAEQAFALDAANLAYRYKVGALLRRVGEPAAAIPHLRAVLDAQPWNYQAAFSLSQSFQDMGQADEAATMLTRADRLRAEQQDVARYGREARTQPENFQTQLIYADALRRSGRLTEALKVYNVALSLRPQNLALQTNIATLYAQTGRHAEAETLFNEVLRIDSTYAEAWVNLGLLYMSTGQRAKADSALHRAFRYGEDNPAIEGFRERLRQRR